MSEIWYKTSSWGERITSVEIERYSDTSVWISGKRRARVAEYAAYFPTWQAAKDYLLARAERKLESARLALQRAQGDHGNIVGMKAPADA